MTAILVQHEVADYDAWFPVFDAHADIRVSHGATGHRVYRDGNSISTLIDFPDADSAAAFMADPSLKTAMADAGVIGAPSITVLTETDVRGY